MAKYTTEVRSICETLAGKTGIVGLNDTKSVIDASVPLIFDFDFPIFDESYRSVLEKKIIKHYYTREIGLETYGLWKLKLDTKLNEIMPYYNQLYKSTLLEFNPFYDVNLTRNHSGKNNGTRNDTGSLNENVTNDRSINGSEKDAKSIQRAVVNNGSSGDTTKDLYSDTPQGALTNVENETYLTNARITSSAGTDASTVKEDITQEDDVTRNESNNDVENRTNNTTNNSTINNTDEYLETVTGKMGTENYSDLLEKYRKTFLNIDMRVIDELNELFMLLW